MTKKEQMDQLFPNCKHEIVHEFKKGRYPNNFRGDRWCKKSCGWAIHSSESNRLQAFGLMRNPNPPSVKGLLPGTRDGDMFRVEL